MEYLILADDLTGAADCALAFTQSGHRADVLLDLPAAPRAQADVVLAIDLDTRHLPPAEAAARTVAAHGALDAGHPLYKKIDSTLRGPWAAEVAALHPKSGVALVATAYPAQGRTVKDGRVFVDGQPLEETAVWRLARSEWPAAAAEALQRAGLRTAVVDTHAHLDEPRRLAAAMARAVLQGAQALVCDAQSDEALATLAAADGRMTFRRFWVGSAGMAAAIARGQVRYPAIEDNLVVPRPRLVVTVVGSLSDVSDRQCEVLQRECPVEAIVVDLPALRGEASDVATRVRFAEAFASGAHLLVRIGRDGRESSGPDGALATRLAEWLRPYAPQVGAWILTGGETARGILRMHGIERLRVRDAIEPGVVLAQGHGRAAANPLVVTKAGAFGSEATLERAWRRVAESPSS